MTDPTLPPAFCGAHWILRFMAILATLLLLFLFGLLGRMDRDAEAATHAYNTCISAMVMSIDPATNIPTTSTTPMECR